MQRTIDHLASGAAEGREASVFLSPETVSYLGQNGVGIAPEPVIVRYEKGIFIYAETPATQQLYLQ